MTILSETAATQIARTYAHTDAALPASAYHVRRVDGGHDYYLVVCGEGENAQAEVTIDAETGKVLSVARLSGSGSTIRIDAATAIAHTGLGFNATADLVWCPCHASMSPLYPLWEVQDGGRTMFVDQAGAVWQELLPGGPGGKKPPDQ